MGVFAVALAFNLRRVDPVPCHCFGSSTEEPRPRRAAMRVVMLLLVVGGLEISTEQGYLTTAPTVPHVLLAIAALIVSVWAYSVPELFAIHEAVGPNLGARPKVHDPRLISYRGAPLRPLVEHHGWR